MIIDCHMLRDICASRVIYAARHLLSFALRAVIISEPKADPPKSAIDNPQSIIGNR